VKAAVAELLVQVVTLQPTAQPVTRRAEELKATQALAVRAGLQVVQATQVKLAESRTVAVAQTATLQLVMVLQAAWVMAMVAPRATVPQRRAATVVVAAAVTVVVVVVVVMRRQPTAVVVARAVIT
jgi:hypothetical protein